MGHSGSRLFDDRATCPEIVISINVESNFNPQRETATK